MPHVHRFSLSDISPLSPPPSPSFSQLRHHLEQLASLMGGIASKLATMKRQIMSGRVLEKERGRVGGRREELEYLNNLAPCGWDDRSVILKEGPAAREMRGCNET